jgi:predicted DNA-binding transcriptional regulator YafY
LWTLSVRIKIDVVSRPATRVLALLEVLQDRGLVPAAELADRLEIDARTVRRYATALRELGIPVESTRGRYGGYRLAPGYRLPPLMLSDDEAVAVAVALAAAGEREELGEPSSTDRALIKLNRMLPPALRARVNALASATAVVADRRFAATPEPELALTLAAAVRARRQVRIEHIRPDGQRTTRDVDPYGLVVHRRRWYLVGHDHLREAVRTYRVDRIASAAELPRRFTAPDGFDPVAHVMHTLTLGAWTHRTEVWLDTDADTARGFLPPTFGELHPDPDGGVLLVSGAEDIQRMARMLTNLPWRFTVRQPAALTEALEAHVTALAEAVARSRTSH